VRTEVRIGGGNGGLAYWYIREGPWDKGGGNRRIGTGRGVGRVTALSR